MKERSVATGTFTDWAWSESAHRNLRAMSETRACDATIRRGAAEPWLRRRWFFRLEGGEQDLADVLGFVFPWMRVKWPDADQPPAVSESPSLGSASPGERVESKTS